MQNEQDHAVWVCDRCGSLDPCGAVLRRSLISGEALCDDCHLAQRNQKEKPRMEKPQSAKQGQLSLFGEADNE